MIYALGNCSGAHFNPAHEGGRDGEDRGRRLPNDVQAHRENKEEGSDELADQLCSKGVFSFASKLIWAHNTEQSSSKTGAQEFIPGICKAPSKPKPCTRDINAKRHSWVECSS